MSKKVNMYSEELTQYAKDIRDILVDEKPLPKIVKQFDPAYVQYKGEYNFEPSETIPDQSMSVAEIMRRYASGLPLGGERVGMYDDDDDDTIQPDFRTMDLADVEEYQDRIKEELAEIKDRLTKPTPPLPSPPRRSKPNQGSNST